MFLYSTEYTEHRPFWFVAVAYRTNQSQLRDLPDRCLTDPRLFKKNEQDDSADHQRGAGDNGQDQPAALGTVTSL